MKNYIYKCSFEMDNGAYRKSVVEYIVSKKELSEDEILQTLYKVKPYSDYDTYIDKLQVIPVVLVKDIAILGRNC